MIDLDFYAALPYGALYRESRIHPGIWTWTPKYCLLTYPDSPEHISQLTEAGWLPIGTLDNKTLDNVSVLFSQLGQVSLLGTPEQGTVWLSRADYDHLARTPVLLAFTLEPAQGQKGTLYVSRTVPPANLGEIGIILVGEGDQVGFKSLRIGCLSRKCQKLQQNMGAALSRLEQRRHLERAAWLEQWREIQAMARKLADGYWRAYQDSQVERPQPINIWKLHQGEAALAAMTMVQVGAHAGFNNPNKWEKDAHMIHEGRYQGVKVGRFVHQTDHTANEYWLQPQEEQQPAAQETPVDPDLVSKELLAQQAKLGDMECDLSNLAPIYLLASGQEEVYISPEQIAKDLGYAPKKKGGYSAGFKAEELQRIKDAFERLALLRFKTSQTIQKRRGVKPALVTEQAPYLIITGWKWQEPLDGFGPAKFLGWKYRMTWLEKFTGSSEAGKQLGILLKKSFAYRQDQRWEKRLARCLTLHLNVAAHRGQSSINRIIRNVLEECGLAPTARDKAHPGAYAQQFENAMDRLKHDGIIGDWKPKLDRHAPDFPTRDWLDLWLDSSFHVTQAPTALKAGYQKMIDARQPRQKGE